MLLWPNSDPANEFVEIFPARVKYFLVFYQMFFKLSFVNSLITVEEDVVLTGSVLSHFIRAVINYN